MNAPRLGQRGAAVAAVVVLLAALGVPIPRPAGAQTSSSAAAPVLPPPEVLGDCTDAVPVIVASDADAQSDIYSAVTLVGVLAEKSCIVLAGARDEPFPQNQLRRLATAATGGYVVGGPAAVSDVKLAGRDMTRVHGADRWETATAVGTIATAIASGEDPSPPGDTANPPDESTPASQQRLAAEFSAALRSSAAPEDMCMSLYLNGEPVFEHGANTPLLPASLAKLATVTAALSELGADATFTTQVVADASALAAVRDGVLRGDLYLIGGGDPVLATPGYINRIADARPYTDVTELADSVMETLDALGIDTIDGAVVGDGSWFADGEQNYTTHYPPGATSETPPIWKQSYLSQNFVGVLSGLIINDGYSPYAVNRRSHTRSTDSVQAAASNFDDLLEARGVVIRHRPRSGSAPAANDSTDLGSITSPTVAEMLVRILRYSENTPAEMLLKQIGRLGGDSSRAASVAAATAALANVLGTAAAEIVLVDGSGLSVHNRMSCEAAVRLLLLAGADSRFVDSLSIAGRTPTLQSCGPQTPANGNGPTNTVFAKGGQLNDSSAIAGVSTAANGDVLTFAMIANEPLIIRIGSCNSLRQRTLNAIGRYTYGPTP
ncbi:D-alanyl-D-alanine carboxypeptidase/D-alanyl-D-alanine-endopeptidase [Candidatus Poriferisodalis sp.]|uniref:D-alanyl-D-alanine carboxypeptidase/D-alanyl-D-alanine-endopeptidase n=1 Tax=Candidatus Poriferisodalis sp. TaxID=3101277 RepID=UPI003B0174BB